MRKTRSQRRRGRLAALVTVAALAAAVGAAVPSSPVEAASWKKMANFRDACTVKIRYETNSTNAGRAQVLFRWCKGSQISIRLQVQTSPAAGWGEKVWAGITVPDDYEVYSTPWKKGKATNARLRWWSHTQRACFPNPDCNHFTWYHPYALPVDYDHLAERPGELFPGQTPGTYTHHDYNASDIGGPTGEPIYAVTSGTVKYTSASGTCGRGLVLTGDDGYTYTFCHGNARNVDDGARVSVGQQIMEMGNTGRSDGTHLHLGMKNPQGVAQCPQAYMAAWFQGKYPAIGALDGQSCSH